jgi:hypothetical protein
VFFTQWFTQALTLYVPLDNVQGVSKATQHLQREVSTRQLFQQTCKRTETDFLMPKALTGHSKQAAVDTMKFKHFKSQALNPGKTSKLQATKQTTEAEHST